MICHAKLGSIYGLSNLVKKPIQVLILMKQNHKIISEGSTWTPLLVVDKEKQALWWCVYCVYQQVILPYNSNEKEVRAIYGTSDWIDYASNFTWNGLSTSFKSSLLLALNKDGHAFHISIDVGELACNNSIHLRTLSSCHILQPLDIGVIQSLISLKP